MIKKIFLFFFLLILISCSNYKFVYDNVNNFNKIKGKTYLNISGEDAEIIHAYLIKQIKNSKQDYLYKLNVISSKSIEAKVIEEDATASKFSIKYEMNYILIDKNNNCVILDKEILSYSSYDSKSAGYSFGSDLSKKESSSENIYSNINEFLNYIDTFNKNLECKNEN